MGGGEVGAVSSSIQPSAQRIRVLLLHALGQCEGVACSFGRDCHLTTYSSDALFRSGLCVLGHAVKVQMVCQRCCGTLLLSLVHMLGGITQASVHDSTFSIISY